jgi:hypothetical protein
VINGDFLFLKIFLISSINTDCIKAGLSVLIFGLALQVMEKPMSTTLPATKASKI